MKAAYKNFVVTKEGEEDKVMQDVTDFLTALGPTRFISLAINLDTICVWYWEPEPIKHPTLEEYREFRMRRGSLLPCPPITYSNTSPQPGTVMCEKK
jgi:hypothetical protein